eukprot:scaffold1896_cov86-Skeletonema_dohrnii-CCMP3373.AAC.3
MADHADDGDGGDGDIFIYRGGRAHQHVTHVLIDRSVEVIEQDAFKDCEQLVKVETHDDIRSVWYRAFYGCKLLRGVNLRSVDEIGEEAFYKCISLADVEIGNKLDTIEECVFGGCSSLKKLNLPYIVTIKSIAFCNCKALTDIEFSDRLETIGGHTFSDCSRLQRIAIPLKRDLITYDDLLNEYNQFEGCDQLKTVDLVGGIHKTVASFHLESWSTEMIAEINRINQVLPNTPADEKTDEIRQWMDSVINKMDHYKAEHCRYVKESVTLLELALWKAKLDEKEDSSAEGRAKKAKIDVDSVRRDRRVTCGADIVIKNVLPFLQLE